MKRLTCTTFNNINEICTFLAENYGWTVLWEKETNPYIKFERSDGEIELIDKKDLETIALEMWETSKSNNLDSEIIKEIEETYFKN